MDHETENSFDKMSILDSLVDCSFLNINFKVVIRFLIVIIIFNVNLVLFLSSHYFLTFLPPLLRRPSMPNMDSLCI